MTNNARVFHVSGKFSLKHSQVVKGISNCAYAWVEFGKIFRNLSPMESIAQRNQQAREAEPLPLAELRNTVFTGHTDYSLIAQANRFCADAGR